LKFCFVFHDVKSPTRPTLIFQGVGVSLTLTQRDRSVLFAESSDADYRSSYTKRVYTTPMYRNHCCVAKCIIETPAITKLTPERKYDKSVLSFASSVRSKASRSRRMSFFFSNSE
jgi:hypothetical protein